VRGKYASRYRAGTNLVLLSPGVAKHFPDEPGAPDAGFCIWAHVPHLLPLECTVNGIRLPLTSVTLQATVNCVRIRNFAHKGLRALYAENGVKGVPPDSADKLRKMLAFLDAMQDPEELRALASWKPHTLTGDRKGTWSLTVTRNRRLTFRIHTADREICDLNLEDYH
jgi:toxin HigB-1